LKDCSTAFYLENEMSYYIGIDLGTSSVKTLLLSEKGIVKTHEESYPVESPKPEFFEQNPYVWYDKTISALEILLSDIDKSEVKSISFSGQMHGLVILDKSDNVLRPAILWNDGRSAKEVDYLNNKIGKDFLLKNTGNIAFAGFTAPKLLWVKNNEPQIFEKIYKIMLPKDYLAYLFSGNFATDVSDASGTLYFDVMCREWSVEMLDLIGIGKEMLPKVFESDEIIGELKEDIAVELGLPESVKIIIGAGDNAASAIGTGTINSGDCNISLGTSGTIFVETENFGYDDSSAIHSFASANRHYHYLACMLSAASAQKWWIENILKTNYNMESAEKYLCKNSMYFLPYLTGERSPVNDEKAKAMFIGMTPETTRDEMTLSVLEGVAYALKQNIEIIRSLGVDIKRSKICGGGAKNELWLKIIANVLDITLDIPEHEQGASLGAALLAAKGIMAKDEYRDFSLKFYGIKKQISPDENLVEKYKIGYHNYLKLYPAIKNIF
jgi:xylulokinase